MSIKNFITNGKQWCMQKISKGRVKGAMPPPKFVENIVILCFERRFSKQNSVIRLKSNILVPLKIFGLPPIFGLAMPLHMDTGKHIHVDGRIGLRSYKRWSLGLLYFDFPKHCL